MPQVSYLAFLARGIDSKTASALVAKGLTIGKIQGFPSRKLEKLGFSKRLLTRLISGSRPPIPRENLFRLLYDSRRTCCICRRPNRPIIIHHIVEWAKSHSHNIDNLAVLCLEDHDLAHTKKGLSLGLSASEIRRAKQEWQRQVQTMDAKAVLGLFNHDGSRWDYINYARIFELMLRWLPHRQL
jgi:hypothetical protein